MRGPDGATGKEGKAEGRGVVDVTFAGMLANARTLPPSAAAERAQQQHNLRAARDEIDAADRPVIDPHLRHSLAHRFHVAGIAQREAPDARHDPGTRIAIPQAVERGGKSRRLPDFDPTELSRRRDNEAWRCNHRAAGFVRFGRMDPAALRQVPRCWADNRLACRCAVYLACRRTDMHKGMDRLRCWRMNDSYWLRNVCRSPVPGSSVSAPSPPCTGREKPNV
jgi:hypothetical protein